MISMCTFGKLEFAGQNKGRVAAKKFKQLLDHASLRAIASRFDAFNARSNMRFQCQIQYLPGFLSII
jgi:hypothetical protein